MEPKIELEPGAAAVLRRLHAAGYRAYAVGGCVRDALRGQRPHDWDLCTSARPEQVLALFGAARCIPTGLKHGTVTVRQGEGRYEVTTFRTEGAYSDGRHPDTVAFIAEVREDLARRDFTINAMAYNEQEGLIDPFGGAADLLHNRVVRAVGDPAARFEEDALRILRLLRFASRLGFAMEPETLAAARAAREKLRCVSAERQREELVRLLCTPQPSGYLDPDIIGTLIPELLPCIGLDQHSPRHRWDVWGHLLRTVDAAPPIPEVRLAALLHDIAKPACFAAQGEKHFPGHAAASAAMARTILRRLKASNAMTETVCLLVGQHTMHLPAGEEALRRAAKRYLYRMGPEKLRLLVALRRADCAGHGDATGEMAREAEAASRLLAAAETVLRTGECYTEKQLAVTGRDLMEELGLAPGRTVGALRTALLEQVLDETLPNDRAALLSAARELLNV